ncbi:MAG: hydroxyacylglutathione hydrolase [Deltaproteobacteria bacterium]|nr:MAG: hydroxyacylglutathione hydrolase [Deltaproteobacteria bacterium]
MLSVKQFRYNADNFGYLVYGSRTAIAIDPGAPEAMAAFAAAHHLRFSLITNTHSHGDHTCGNKRMEQLTGAPFRKCTTFTDNESLTVDTDRIRVFRSPGHSDDSIVFYTGTALISGDTLFNGTVGNCFSGDLDGFYNSLRRLMALPDKTIVYAGHDYVRESIAFANAILPGEPAVKQFMDAYTSHHVMSTLGDEKKVNPFLRFDDPAMIGLLEARGCSASTSRGRFMAIMQAF